MMFIKKKCCKLAYLHFLFVHKQEESTAYPASP